MCMKTNFLSTKVSAMKLPRVLQVLLTAGVMTTFLTQCLPSEKEHDQT